MSQTEQQLTDTLASQFGDVQCSYDAIGELVVDAPRDTIVALSTWLRDEQRFEQLIDLCGVDYLHFGLEGTNPEAPTTESSENRFRVVYHLLSISRNKRIRVRAVVDEKFPTIDSVSSVWSVADWFERETFDLFGIMFEGHPDLRRLLTDYGFIGHPFRKDFPLSGHVEMRYDPEKGRVVYQPVSIEPRVLVPRRITAPPAKVQAQPEQQPDAETKG